MEREGEEREGRRREREVLEERKRRSQRLETRGVEREDGGGRRRNISWRSSSHRIVSMFGQLFGYG